MTANKLLSRAARRKKAVETAFLIYLLFLTAQVKCAHFPSPFSDRKLELFPTLIRTGASEAVDFFGSKETLGKHGFSLVARAVIPHEIVNLTSSESVFSESSGSALGKSTLPEVLMAKFPWLWNLGCNRRSSEPSGKK